MLGGLSFSINEIHMQAYMYLVTILHIVIYETQKQSTGAVMSSFKILNYILTETCYVQELAELSVLTC